MEVALLIPGRVRTTVLRFIMGVKYLWGEIKHQDVLHHSLFLEYLKQGRDSQGRTEPRALLSVYSL